MNVYVARQPIFDINQKIFGYELLFREGMDNLLCIFDQDKATSEVIGNSFLTMNIDKLCDRKKCFINFTGNLLKSELATILSPDYVVIEILENVEPDSEIIIACRKLKNQGYTIALDDFIMKPSLQPLVNLADIIKIDYRVTTTQYQQQLINKLGGKIKFLAEKIETWEEFKIAKKIGFSYFQGYFFSKPAIITSKDIPANKMSYLRLLSEINRSELDYSQIEAILKSDVSLSYKLLKFINSAVFGFKTEISSIKHALTLLGTNEIKKWFSLIILKTLGGGKPNELIVSSYLRANFAEFVAHKLNLVNEASNIFFMGLLSMIDALLDRPLSEILEDLSLPDDIKRALLGTKNLYGDIYKLIISYEKADWESYHNTAARLDLDEEEVSGFYLKALEITQILMQDA